MVSSVTDVFQRRGAVLFVTTDPNAVAGYQVRIGRKLVAPRWVDTAAAIHCGVVPAGAASHGDAAP